MSDDDTKRIARNDNTAACDCGTSSCTSSCASPSSAPSLAPLAAAAVTRSKKLRKRVLDPMPVFDEDSLYAAFAEHGIKRSHSSGVWKHLTRNVTATIDSVPNIPATARTLLRDKFAITTSRLVEAKVNSNGSTTKLLIELQDGHRVEAVVIRYDKDADRDVSEGGGDSRVTLCVSSQVGCQMGCTFCATGTMGLLGNLTGGEMCEQLYHANTIAKIDNVVFMGMGEPLSNYDSVLSAIRGMTDANRFNLANYRITLSTVGIVPKMLQLTREMPSVHLALSLHAPTQEMRTKIVPSGRAFKLEQIMDALDDHLWRTGRCVMVEYVMLGGINDSIETAHLLGKLLQGKKVKVNLIPYNPTSVREAYVAPASGVTAAFAAVVRTYALFCSVRQEKGPDIDGACGQLVISSSINTASSSSCTSSSEATHAHEAKTIVSLSTDVGATVGDIEDMAQWAADGAYIGGHHHAPHIHAADDLKARTRVPLVKTRPSTISSSSSSLSRGIVRKKNVSNSPAINTTELSSSSSSSSSAPSEGEPESEQMMGSTWSRLFINAGLTFVAILLAIAASLVYYFTRRLP